MHNRSIISALLLASLSTPTLLANDAPDEADDRGKAIDLIKVVGERSARLAIPGSATRIDAETLELVKYDDIQRILRMAPGVNIQEEEGYGLRPNIGLRGSGVQRSSKITIMEDGVLIAPAPYAAPSAYYFPTASRMESVDVRKGSSAIKFGPRTVGGAINLISRSFPNVSGGFVDFRYGSDNTFSSHSMAAMNEEQFGIMGEWVRSGSDGFKKLQGGVDTGYDISDWIIKARVNTADDAAVYQSLQLKIGRVTNNSDETYLGITESDFARSPYERYAVSELDHMETTQKQMSLTHKLESGDFQMMTVAYKNDFARDWFKFDKISIGGVTTSPGAIFDEPGANQLGYEIFTGISDSDVGAIRLKHNNREYESKGIQSVMAYSFNTGDVAHKLEFSVRYHEDYEDRLQNYEDYTMLNGSLVFAGETEQGSAGNRISSAKAWAFYLSDEITVGKWTIVPGVRLEDIDLMRRDWASGDVSRNDGLTSLKQANHTVVIPGVGVSYRISDDLLLMGGLHKGFNPPGAGDANAEEETSTNYELGLVYLNGSTIIEAVSFFSDYDNILGTCSNAIGCVAGNIGDQFNGGKAHIYGLELSAEHMISVSDSIMLTLGGNYTYTHATFRTDFSDGFWGDVNRGDFMPYIPLHQLNTRATLSDDKWQITALMNWQSKTRTSAGQNGFVSDEMINSRAIFDLSTNYKLSDEFTLYAKADNVFDKTYAVARRPYGLRPGKSRTWMIGGKLTF